MSTEQQAERDYTGEAVEAYIKMRKTQERAVTAEAELSHWLRQPHDRVAYAEQTIQWDRDYEDGKVRFAGAPPRRAS